MKLNRKEQLTKRTDGRPLLQVLGARGVISTTGGLGGNGDEAGVDDSSDDPGDSDAADGKVIEPRLRRPTTERATSDHETR